MEKNEHPAVLVIDMVKDYFDLERNLKITPFAKAIIKPIRDLTKKFRDNNWPVIYSTDSFKEDDFIFTGRMKPEAIAGTEGAEIIDELEREETDLWVPKPRFSAFFKTGLDNYLKNKGVTLCAVAGIATPFCVLTTALDSIAHDFKTVIVSDCSAATTERVHQDTLDLYRKTALYPLLCVKTSQELLSDLGGW